MADEEDMAAEDEAAEDEAIAEEAEEEDMISDFYPILYFFLLEMGLWIQEYAWRKERVGKE